MDEPAVARAPDGGCVDALAARRRALRRRHRGGARRRDADRSYGERLMATAAILTIGNELVSGDVPNSNGSWLARRLAPLGVSVRLIAALPDEIDAIAEFVRR